MRVLSNDANGVNVEVSLQTAGMIRGVPENSISTYEVLARPDGSVQGGGNGIMTTQDGDVIALIDNGSGTAVSPGETTNFRTMLHSHTTSAKFADLNGSAWAGEYDVNADGSAVKKFGSGNDQHTNMGK